MRKKNKCVIWTRVSTAKQEKNGGSLDYQRQLCEQYAREHGLQIVGYFGGTHESAKVPGTLFKEMIKSVKKDLSIGKILCSEFDRFSRNAPQAIGIIRELYDLGVPVCSVKQGFQTDTKDNIMIASSLLLMATWDNDKRADKFYSGRKHCYESGAYTGVLPIGYTRIDPKTGIRTKSLNSYCYLDEQGKKINGYASSLVEKLEEDHVILDDKVIKRSKAKKIAVNILTALIFITIIGTIIFVIWYEIQEENRIVNEADENLFFIGVVFVRKFRRK